MNECKNCRADNDNGTKFCSRKCRIKWIKKHEKKGAKKRDMAAPYISPLFDSDGNAQ